MLLGADVVGLRLARVGGGGMLMPDLVPAPAPLPVERVIEGEPAACAPMLEFDRTT